MKTGQRFVRVVAVPILAAAVVWLTNIGGFQSRITTRLLRVENRPVVVRPPAGFLPQVPPGFSVSVFATGFQEPRWLAVAPDGAIFVADSAAGQVIVLHEGAENESDLEREVFAEGLTLPFGIAFLDEFVYIADTDEVVRFRYNPRTSQRIGSREHILDLPGHGYNQHWTRSLAVARDRKQLFVSVGSETNVSIESDPRRASIVSFSADGTKMRIYASGLRNAVGLAIHPETRQLWTAVNERDNLGDDIPSDYFTGVIDGGFYGWPYVYGGTSLDNRVTPKPGLTATTIKPDVPLGAHVAPLQFVFYEGKQFPSEYRNGAFIAEHGSWNRRARAGYAIVFLPFRYGVPSGKPKPFLIGFITDAQGKEVYGRPVGVAVTHDGSLLVSDDGSRSIWRVSYQPSE